MTQEEKINYWIKSSEVDFKAMNNLFDSADYSWSLFIGHLVIEKLLKALYVKHNNEQAPPIHNLLRLAEKSNLSLTKDQSDNLGEINKFNIATRYPDQKQKFYKICTKDFTIKYIKIIKEVREWLIQIIMK